MKFRVNREGLCVSSHWSALICSAEMTAVYQPRAWIWVRDGTGWTKGLGLLYDPPEPAFIRCGWRELAARGSLAGALWCFSKSSVLPWRSGARRDSFLACRENILEQARQCASLKRFSIFKRPAEHQLRRIVGISGAPRIHTFRSFWQVKLGVRVSLMSPVLILYWNDFKWLVYSFILNLSNLLILICGNLCDCCAHKLYFVSFHCYMVVNKNRWQFDTFSVTSCSEWRSTSCFLIYRWCRAHFGRNPSSGYDRCVRVLLCFRGNSAYRLMSCPHEHTQRLKL